MPDSAERVATLTDLYAIPDAERSHELIGGSLVPRAAPSAAHGDAQAGVVGVLRLPFQRSSGRGGPGGWWILSEVDVLLASGDVVRPDVVGWRREQSPERPSGMPVELRPDWACEVISASHAKNDTVAKLRLYHSVGIPHYWLVDPREATLRVLRHSEAGYVTVLVAERGEVVRAEPFDAIEVAVGTWFGDDPPA